MKKLGRKKGPQGKQASPKSRVCTAMHAAAKSKKFNAKLIAALALRRGEAMGPGEARMCLIVTMRLFEEADLKVDANRKTVAGLRPVLVRAAQLCSSSFEVVSRIFWSYVESNGETFDVTDNSSRGRGSSTVEKATLYRINEAQSAKIKEFVEYRNSATGQGKVSLERFNTLTQSNPAIPCTSSQVTLEEIGNYMRDGPHEQEPEAPPRGG
jgi:hypothetical protein